MLSKNNIQKFCFEGKDCLVCMTHFNEVPCTQCTDEEEMQSVGFDEDENEKATE